MEHDVKSNPLPTALGRAAETPPGFLGVLTRLGTRIKLEAGSDLFRQGDAADALFVLNAGALEVSILSEEGRKLTLNFLKAGTVFGEIGLLDDGPRSATVTAAENCDVLKVERRDFLNEIRSNPEFSVDMIRLCVDRLRWVNAQLEDHVFHPLEVRLARRLVYLMDTRGEGRVLPMSQSSLADHAGVTREAVARLLSEWKAAGIVTPSRGQITIQDLPALLDRAAMGRV